MLFLGFWYYRTYYRAYYIRDALPVYVLNIPGCELCWPMVLMQSAGLDEGDWMSGSRRRAGAVSDRPAQLQQPGQIFLLAFSIG